ncbi:MAG: hypothetical protein JWP02_2350 [Acidimicrobiales bacterium]|nr:hypothetical protein [Acidimicrobiales bacterium]
MERMGGAWLWARAQWRRQRRALVALTLLLGLFAGVALACFAGARRTATSYQRFRRAALARDLQVQIAGDDGADVLQQALQLPGVRAAGVFGVYVAFGSLNHDFDYTITAPKDGQFGLVVDRPRVLAGRLPRPDRIDEVALNSRAAAQLRASIGQVIMLATLTPDQLANIQQGFSGRPEGPPLRLHVTGFVRSVDDLTGKTASAGVFATPAFDHAYRAGAGNFGDVAAVRLAGGTRNVASFESRVRALAGDRSVDLTASSEAGKEVTDAVRILGVALAIMGAVVLVAALVAGGQAVNRQLWAAAGDQPVLAGLGMTRAQRVLGEMLLMGPVAAGAAVVAVALAWAASPLTPLSLARQAEPRAGLAFDGLVLVGGAAAVTLLVLVATAASAWHLARRAISDDRSPARPSQMTALALRMGSGPSVVTGVNMALDRGRGRNAVPVRPALVGAAVGVAGLVAALTFAASLGRLGDTPSRYGQAWDLTPDLVPDDAGRVAALQEVGGLGVLHTATVQVQGRAAHAYSIDVMKGAPTFSVLAGHAPRTQEEVAIGPDLSGQLGAGIGDRVEFGAKDGVHRLRVVGRVLTPGTQDDPISGGVVLHPDALAALAQSEIADQAVINWAPGLDPSTAERRFRVAFPSAVSAYSRGLPPGNVANLARVQALPRALGGLLALIAVLATGHALVTAVRRRRHDLAILRTLGFVRRQVGAAVAWQSTTLAAIGVVVGVPLGVVLGRWAWRLVATGVGVAPDAVVPVWALLVAPAALVVANVLAAAPGLAAARVEPAAVLRAE